MSVNKVSQQFLLDEILQQVSRNLPKDLHIIDGKIDFLGSGYNHSWGNSLAKSSPFPKGEIAIESRDNTYIILINLDYSFVVKLLLLVAGSGLILLYAFESMNAAWGLLPFFFIAFARVLVDIIAIRSLVKKSILQIV
ncbi:MAG: hypothetical protein IPP69_16715 [Flavobacteriales bacterium]|nr:hypothetical protein [Flavobacteriales bacterium]